MARYEGRLELTWTNKDLRLLSHENSYEWVDPNDHRVAEVRLLHELSTYGETSGDQAADNLLIQGDALHGLRSLAALPEFSQKYLGQVELAYLDPPFNTGQAFGHYDDALEHSVWLTMMRDRLMQIRLLLSETGSVWVHLDDQELHRARMVLDEVFGADNFMGSVIWRSSDNSNNHATTVSLDHNTILIYGKSPEWESYLLPARSDQLGHFKNPDNDPRGPWFDGNPVNNPAVRPNLRYDLPTPGGKTISPPPNGWRWSKETLLAKIASGEVRFTNDESSIRRRTYLNDHKGLPTSSLWVDIEETGHNRQAKYELRKLFPGTPTSDLFPTPKPERLLKRILEVATRPGDIVLDCFAGSGTTAAVAHKMGRRWVTIERSDRTVSEVTSPRLQKVVDGLDTGGISKQVKWAGGGAWRLLSVAPSMFEADADMVFLSEETTNGRLAETTAAQLGFSYKPNPPFAGYKGRSRLVVVDGVVNEPVVKLLVDCLDEGELIVICGTGIDPSARDALKQLRPGSTLRKIPSALLASYRYDRPEYQAQPAQAAHEVVSQA